MKGWIVTKDHLDKVCGQGSTKNVEVIGPRGCTLTKEELLNGHPFKMFDDDKNLYYEGFLVGNKKTEDGFMPLDHYGMPNAGCTYIQYKNDDGEWETL